MAKAPGRNAPCPCGSGRKYKNCCLPADEARERASRTGAPAASTLSVWDDLDDEPIDDFDGDVEDDFDLLATPTPSPDDPLIAAQNALWDRFEAADYDTQIALFQEALRGDTLDADLAYEMLTQIESTARERGELDRFNALVDQYARKAPELYQEDAVHYASWLIESALESGETARIPAALEPFARDPAAAVDELFRVADQLLYYDQTAPLLDALRRGWNPLNRASLVHDEAIEDYTDLLLDVLVLEYARTAPEPGADDPALARQLAAYLDPAGVAYCQQNAAALLGTLGRQWHARDFESPPAASRASAASVCWPTSGRASSGASRRCRWAARPWRRKCSRRS